jgi:hypothetical protein
MLTLIYNHNDFTIRTSNSEVKSCVNFNKQISTFSCEASDLNETDIHVPEPFTVKLEENGHTKVFSYTYSKRDDEGDLLYYVYKSSDQYKFIIFND